MCDKCNQTECCCNEKRVSIAGKKGDPGKKGTSAYFYVAYADDVTAGSPDVVIGFSTTDGSKCWTAAVTSLIPLVPVEADFQGKWFNRCVGPCTCDITADGDSAAIDQTISNAVYTPITGAAIPLLPAGTYLFWGEINAGLAENTVVEYTMYDGVGAIGVNRRVGNVSGLAPNQHNQVLAINEKITIAVPTNITMAARVTGDPMTITKRSLQYIKIG